MKTILHNRISETSYNVELAIIDGVYYMVKYGKQVETYDMTAHGLLRATQEYIECCEHAKRLEKLS